MLWQIASILCVCIISLFCFVVFFCQSVGSLSRHIDSKQLSYTHEHLTCVVGFGEAGHFGGRVDLNSCGR